MEGVPLRVNNGGCRIKSAELRAICFYDSVLIWEDVKVWGSNVCFFCYLINSFLGGTYNFCIPATNLIL